MNGIGDQMTIKRMNYGSYIPHWGFDERVWLLLICENHRAGARPAVTEGKGLLERRMISGNPVSFELCCRVQISDHASVEQKGDID